MGRWWTWTHGIPKILSSCGVVWMHISNHLTDIIFSFFFFSISNFCWILSSCQLMRPKVGVYHLNVCRWHMWHAAAPCSSNKSSYLAIKLNLPRDANRIRRSISYKRCTSTWHTRWFRAFYVYAFDVQLFLFYFRFCFLRWWNNTLSHFNQSHNMHIAYCVVWHTIHSHFRPHRLPHV